MQSCSLAQLKDQLKDHSYVKEVTKLKLIMTRNPIFTSKKVILAKNAEKISSVILCEVKPL